MDPTRRSETEPIAPVGTASEYRFRYGRTMMVLKGTEGVDAVRGDLCRVASVDTIAPDLWITVRFLDGKTGRLRPDKIRPATAPEQKLEQISD